MINMIIDTQKNINNVAEDIATEIATYVMEDMTVEDRKEWLFDLRNSDFYNMNVWISDYTDDIHQEAFEKVMEKLNIKY